MTKPVPFTQAGLKRAIAAARRSGLRVTGIRPDGTLLVDDGDNTDKSTEPPAPSIDRSREIVL